ncbi:MAG: peptide-methionine (S)-S-oxide reductase [Coriobacteriia bacterium]|nr:peptide-methionine (S)-S-oxide reductase [Coriobacteriia bacterium]
MRTRVGYCGGTSPDPTYRAIGDHAETLQVDHDPDRVAYEDLLEVFWCAHRPTSPPWSRQYMSAVFYDGDEQRALAEASRDRVEEATSQRVYTEIAPLRRFYVAEDYHQKYRLRRDRELMREFAEMLRDEGAFRDSTAAARVNGFLDGFGDLALLRAELDGYGLSENGRERLLSLSGGLGVLSPGCPL